jgi:plasmid stabilization system protein ParE
MKVEFANRAVRGLRDISDDSRRQFGDRVAAVLEACIRDVVAGITHAPRVRRASNSGPACGSCPSCAIRSKSFYRVVGDTVTVLHIRHAARRPWNFDDE